MMKDFAFINSKETLKDTLLSLNPPFSTVNQHISPNIISQLSPAEKAFFDNSFLIKN